MQRFPNIEYEDANVEQRAIWDEIVSGPRGLFNGPLLVWIQNAELTRRAQQLGLYARFDSRMPRRLAELAILIVAEYWRVPVEWHDHAPRAIAAGLDPDIVETIRLGGKPEFQARDEAALYAFARELLETKAVSDATFTKAREALADAGLLDLVAIMGYYGLVSMTLKAYEMPLPEGAPNPFA